ncbi:MAG: NAD(+) diphosphatase [Fibrobacter sp.]|nr:NAD(+) diphosphatase [Fibrobacter sp.]
MIHEIAPHVLDNQFKIQDPKLDDYCIVYNGSKSLLKKDESGYAIPTVGEVLAADVKAAGKSTEEKLADFEGHYLLNIDGRAFFLQHVAEDFCAPAGYEFTGNRAFRGMNPVERMGGATAAHIAHWEALNKFCGRCGNITIRGDKERSIICPKCGNIVYPRISPVVIVAVHNGDKLLMAHNIDNPNPRLFLISGFVEVGESLEQAAHREVLEEAGVKIKNLKYFGSQPWAFSDSLIAGFTAELDGDDTIHRQEAELSEAKWVKREDIPPYETDVSISCCLIENFRHI